MADTSRSPLKDKPLRHPGQSLEEERRALIDDKVEPYILMGGFFFLLTLLEWWRYYRDDRPHPYMFSVAAALFVAFGVWRVLRVRPRFRALRLGIEGEKAVGQFLERMRATGYEVFHDVVAPGFNVDHVLIGPAGIFSIETKTWTKPIRGDVWITFDGEQLRAGSQTPDRDPIVQSKAQARWLRGLLLQSTGREFDVFPVVLFPGWFIEQAPGSLREIWVLEPKALPGFLAHAPERLDISSYKLAAFHLSRYVRTSEESGTNRSG